MRLPDTTRCPYLYAYAASRVLTGTTKEMSERSDHSRNRIGKIRICSAKSFILQVYVLASCPQFFGGFFVYQLVDQLRQDF